MDNLDLEIEKNKNNYYEIVVKVVSHVPCTVVQNKIN